MGDERVPDEPDDSAAGKLPDDLDEHHGDAGERRHKRRRRIKIRKRVRIKRKTSPRKKARKILELIAWVLIVAAFIITMIILVLQLDLRTKNKKTRSVAYTETPVFVREKSYVDYNA